MTIKGNHAERWGGGLYAGISAPWHNNNLGIVDEAKVTLQNATIQGNISTLGAKFTHVALPTQIAGEHVNPLPAAVLNCGGSTIVGANPATDIGIYTLNSVAPGTLGTVFLNLAPAWNTLAE